MCLKETFTKEKTNKIISKLKDIIAVYKVARISNTKDEYMPLMFHESCPPYQEGINKAIGLGSHYGAGFYSFASRIKAVIRMRSQKKLEKHNKFVVIKCKIRTEDILSIGKERDGCKAYVTSKIEIPKFKKYKE